MCKLTMEDIIDVLKGTDIETHTVCVNIIQWIRVT